MSKPDVAQWLDVSVGAIDRYRREEGLPFIVMGRRVRFKRSNVALWLKKRSKNGEDG